MFEKLFLKTWVVLCDRYWKNVFCFPSTIVYHFFHLRILVNFHLLCAKISTNTNETSVIHRIQIFKNKKGKKKFFQSILVWHKWSLSIQLSISSTFYTHLFYKSLWAAFFLLTFWLWIFGTNFLYNKLALKCDEIGYRAD